MAIWFFQKYKIQKSLPLALVTHNPVQFIMNIYIISFTIIKYNAILPEGSKIPAVDLINAFACFTLYFPALYWEVSRKIRAPQDETEYVTYSKLFGYKKAANFPSLSSCSILRRTLSSSGTSIRSASRCSRSSSAG